MTKTITNTIWTVTEGEVKTRAHCIGGAFDYEAALVIAKRLVDVLIDAGETNILSVQIRSEQGDVVWAENTKSARENTATE